MYIAPVNIPFPAIGHGIFIHPCLCCDKQAKLERLQRALPRPVNVAHALTQAPALIHQDVSGLVAACVALSQTFAPAQLPLLVKVRTKHDPSKTESRACGDSNRKCLSKSDRNTL